MIWPFLMNKTLEHDYGGDYEMFPKLVENSENILPRNYKMKNNLKHF